PADRPRPRLTDPAGPSDSWLGYRRPRRRLAIRASTTTAATEDSTVVRLRRTRAAAVLTPLAIVGGSDSVMRVAAWLAWSRACSTGLSLSSNAWMVWPS